MLDSFVLEAQQFALVIYRTRIQNRQTGKKWHISIKEMVGNCNEGGGKLSWSWFGHLENEYGFNHRLRVHKVGWASSGLVGTKFGSNYQLEYDIWSCHCTTHLIQPIESYALHRTGHMSFFYWWLNPNLY